MYTKLLLLFSALITTQVFASNNDDEFEKALRLSQQEYDFKQDQEIENNILQESLKLFEEEQKKLKQKEDIIKIVSLNEEMIRQQKEEEELLQQAILLSLNDNMLQIEDDLEEEINIIQDLTPVNVASLFEQVNLNNAHTHTFNDVNGYSINLTMRQNKPILTIFNNPEFLSFQALPGGNDQEKSYKICLQNNPMTLGILIIKKN